MGVTRYAADRRIEHGAVDFRDARLAVAELCGVGATAVPGRKERLAWT
jgi:hypothetical protein